MLYYNIVMRSIMKYQLLGLALLLPCAAFAADTVTFYGEVADSTCNITVNGASGEVSVQLPTVQAAALNSSQTAGKTPFVFTLSGCEAASGATSTLVGMRLLSNSTANSGNLLNIATGTTVAKNVSIQIEDDTPTTPAIIDFSQGEYTTTTKTKPSDQAGTLQFPFSAQYYVAYATGNPATVGKVEAKLQYALTYK